MIYLIITSLVWAFSYGLIKKNLANLDPNFISVFRMTCASLVFLPFLRVNTVKLTAVINLLAIGAVQYGLMYLSFLHSFKYLDAYQIALFTTFTPLYVIIINSLYVKKFNLFYIAVALLALVGGAVIYYPSLNKELMLRGFLLVQISDICFAFGQVAYKNFRQANPHIKDQQIYMLLFLGALITALMATSWSQGWSSYALLTSNQVLILLYLGVIASGLCFFLWNKDVAVTDIGTVAVFNNLKSPLAIAVSIIFFHENANIPRLIISLSIIGTALYLSERHARLCQNQLSQ